MLPLGSVIEAVMGVLTVAVFLAWFLLSVTRYLPWGARLVTRFDHLQLVPQWSFFAPIPNRSDYFLYIRVLTGKRVSPWQEVRLADERRWVAFVWNPGRRVRKGFFDLAAELCRLATRPREEVLVSLPYLHLLLVTTTLVAKSPHDQVQFAIGRTVPMESETEVDILFCSEFHPINLNPGEPNQC
jgi:hypothetical protein